MGAFCCFTCPDDFEEYTNPSNPLYRHYICLRYFIHQLLSGNGTTFQRLDQHSLPSQNHTNTLSSVTRGNSSSDNSSSDIYRLVPRPPPYDADPQYSHSQHERLVSRHGKTSMSHTQDDSRTLRRNNSSSAVEPLGAGKNQKIAEFQDGCKPSHTGSEKNLSAKSCDTALIIGTSEDEDVCPTCLEGELHEHQKFDLRISCSPGTLLILIGEQYAPENPKIVTNCSHHFHLSCIYEWMERSDTCPVCGKEMEFCESP